MANTGKIHEQKIYVLGKNSAFASARVAEQKVYTLGENTYATKARMASQKIYVVSSSNPLTTIQINNNDNLYCNKNNGLTSANLSISRQGLSPSQIIYTLVNNTTWGKLKLYGVDLAVGDTWTQADIDNEDLTYRRTNRTTNIDKFVFDVVADTISLEGKTFTIDNWVDGLLRAKINSRI